MTINQIIEVFCTIRGDAYDKDDVEYHVSEIGNPDASLPITKTSETVEDFISSGWTNEGDYHGTTCVSKDHITAYIADLGNHRLFCAER